MDRQEFPARESWFPWLLARAIVALFGAIVLLKPWDPQSYSGVVKWDAVATKTIKDWSFIEANSTSPFFEEGYQEFQHADGGRLRGYPLKFSHSNNGTRAGAVRGWLWIAEVNVPADRKAGDACQFETRPPLVVTAPGFGAILTMNMDDYARDFAKAGVPALVFDHTSFGISDGEPRHIFSTQTALNDWRLVMKVAAETGLGCTVNGNDIGLFGTSMSGGYVLTLASEQKNSGVKCVVSQTPHLDPRKTLWQTIQARGKVRSARMVWLGLADVSRRFVGMSPLYVRIAAAAGANENACLLPEDNEFELWKQRTEAVGFESNAISASAGLEIAMFRPIGG
eukprot:GHVN01053953.1.p1 GENE.GHVN01053953.1~~GHVN01053953.1.p1  ORF type:complete len:339 (+),score=18.05 GHVN01053953.1:905-1921(+)